MVCTPSIYLLRIQSEALRATFLVLSLSDKSHSSIQRLQTSVRCEARLKHYMDHMGRILAHPAPVGYA